MATYNIKIVDSISDSIPRKLADISQQATNSATSTEKLQHILNKSSAHNRFVTMQQKVAMSNSRVAVSANRTIGYLARLETAQLRAARAAQRAASQHSLYSRSILIGSARIISAISRWMSLLGIGFSIKFITRFTDEFTNLENKLKNVAVSTANLVRLNDEVFASANRARVPVSELAQTYQRIDLAVKGLGFSQKEAMAITETASKALALSGATTGETAAALLQLSQAFNKGKLDGDEFRTVMELMPTAADAIAKQLGVTRGELLELAPQGKITAKVMADAFRNVADEVDDKFSKITPTISQALTVLRNNAIRAWGEFDKSVGITEKLSRAILTLSENLDQVGKFVVGAGAGLAAYFGVTLVAAVLNGQSAVKGLWALISAHPVGALATAIGLLTMALVHNSDQIYINQERMISLRDYAVGAWNLITDNAKYAADAVSITWNQAMDFLTKLWEKWGKAVKSELEAAWRIIKTAANGIANEFISAINIIMTAFDRLPQLMDGVFFLVADSALQMAEDIINAFTGIFFAVQKTGEMIKVVGDATNNKTLQYIGGDLAKNTPQFELPRPGGIFANSTREQSQLAIQEVLAAGKRDSEDIVGGITNGIKEGLDPLKQAFEQAAREAQADRINSRHAILSGKYKKDPYYDQARPVVPTNSSGESAADKVRNSTKKVRKGTVIGVEANAQNFAMTCGKTMAAEIINSNTGKNLQDRDIATYRLLEEINLGLKGTGLRYVDYGDVDNPKAVELAKRAMEKGYAIGFSSNGPGFSDSGKGHWAVGTGFEGDMMSYMDPNKGKMRNMSFTELANRPQYPDGGSGFFGPANIDSLPTRHKDEIKSMKKVIDEEKKRLEDAQKAIDKFAKESSEFLLDSFEPYFDQIEDSNKAWNKGKKYVVEYAEALAQEHKMAKMTSEEAETYNRYLEYRKGAGEYLLGLSFKQFEQKDKEIVQLKKEQQIREQILANSRIGEEKNFQDTLAAGKGLEGKEREAYASSMLEQFVGVDTSLLTSNLNQALTIWEDYHRRLSEMVQNGTLEQKEADEIILQHKLAVMDQGLAATSQLFSDLSSLTKDGSKELIAISKAAAIAQTIFSTYSAAQLAFEKGVAMGGMPLGVIQAAAAVAQGLARVAQIRAQGTEGFMAGGYTGNGPKSAVAGVVHGQEFVFDAQSTSRIGVGNLQALQNGGNLQTYNPPQQNSQAAQPVVVNNQPPPVIVVASVEDAMKAFSGREGESIFMAHLENNKSVVTRMLS